MQGKKKKTCHSSLLSIVSLSSEIHHYTQGLQGPLTGALVISITLLFQIPYQVATKLLIPIFQN